MVVWASNYVCRTVYHYEYQRYNLPDWRQSVYPLLYSLNIFLPTKCLTFHFYQKAMTIQKRGVRVYCYWQIFYKRRGQFKTGLILSRLDGQRWQWDELWYSLLPSPLHSLCLYLHKSYKLTPANVTAHRIFLRKRFKRRHSWQMFWNLITKLQ